MKSKTVKVSIYLAIICALCTFVSMVVQMLIAFGAPLGEFVLGGAYIVAPPSNRLIHAGFSVLWGCVVLAYLIYSEVISIKKFAKVAHALVILNTLFTLYAIVWNFFITSSIKETLLMGPLTLITTVCSIIFLVIKRKLRKN